MKLKPRIYRIFILFSLLIVCLIFVLNINNPNNNFIKEKFDFSNSSYGDYLSASYLVKNYNIEEASKLFRNSYNKEQDDKIFQDYFISAILSGNIEQTIEKVKNKENIILSNLALAINAIKENKYSKAKIYIKNIKESEIDKAIIPIFTIWCDISENKTKNIISDFENMNLPSEKYNIVKFQEAIALDYIDKIEEAKESFDELFIDPQPAYYTKIGANFYEKIGELEKAKSLYKNYDQHNRTNLFSENILKLNQNKLTKSIKIIKDPKQALSIFLSDISFAILQNRLSSQSLIYAQMALYIDPSNEAANFIIGSSNLQNKNYPEAIKYFNNIKANDSLYILAQINVATCFQKLGEVNIAKKILINLSTTKPDIIEPIIILSDIYNEEKNYSESLKNYDNFLSKSKDDNKNLVIYYMRGSIHQLNKNFSEAEADYVKALSINPDNPAILNNLAYNYIEENRNIDQAYIMAKKAISISPEVPQFLDTMGWILYKKGSYSEAYYHLEKAIELLPTDALINEHLGDLYWKLGEIQKAKFEWQHAYDNLNDKIEQERIVNKIHNGL